MLDALDEAMAAVRANDVFIAGQWVPGEGGVQEVVSPATERVVAEVALPSRAQVAAAVAAAHERGRDNWSTLGMAERLAAVRRWCEALECAFPQAGLLWAAEAGMPLRYSKNLHRFGARGAWNAALDVSESALADEWRTGAGGQVLVRREPAGVVVGVMAFNGPLVTLGTKIIPALLAGCPVVVKGAPESQLILRLAAACAEQAELPEGALSILCGDVEVGRAMTADPRVDLVSLTGGHRAAQDIIESTRERFARTHLELGGKSAALIVPDADVMQVLRALVPGAAAGAGQVCALLTRVLVPEHMHDEIVDGLRSAWSALTVGDPFSPDTQIGPLANKAGLRRTEMFLQRALDEGAEVVAGGRRPPGLDTGYYFEPTVMTNVARDSHLARHEVFGPITAVMTYDDLDDGIALANDTELGLAASVFTSDRRTAFACATRLRAGSVAVNTFGPDVGAPWGGRGASGWGREGGAEGIQAFTELKQILLGPGLAADEPA